VPKQKSRIYTVTRKGHGTVRLVRASTWAQALRHVARDEFTTAVATQDQLVEGTRRGVPVEEAAADTPEPPAQQAIPEPAPQVVEMEPTGNAGDVVPSGSDA
jgi:hypothetical protein